MNLKCKKCGNPMALSDTRIVGAANDLVQDIYKCILCGSESYSAPRPIEGSAVKLTTKGKAERVETEQKGVVYDDGQFQITQTEKGKFTVWEFGQYVKGNISELETAKRLIEEFKEPLEGEGDEWSYWKKIKDLSMGEVEPMGGVMVGGTGSWRVFQSPATGHYAIYHRTLGRRTGDLPQDEFEKVAARMGVEFQPALPMRIEKATSGFIVPSGYLSKETLEEIRKEEEKKSLERREYERLKEIYEED